MAAQTVLLLGATGRTGQRTLRQLLGRGVGVRAIVRSRGRLPPDLLGHPGLEVIEASLPSLREEELRGHLRGCTAVLSCLGHVLTLRGLFGPPRDLVTSAMTRVCHGIEALRPDAPVKVVLMTSVSVHRPGAPDARRSTLERAFLWALRGLLPPARDNQRAADFLVEAIGPAHPSIPWVVIRPDTLVEGPVTAYRVHEGIVDGLFSPGRTAMEDVAHFMCELVTDPKAWDAWRGKLPVVG